MHKPERIAVAAEEWLYRRGYSTPERKFMNPDGTATSRVFKLRPVDKEGLSVDVKSLTTPDKAISDPSKFMLFEIANQEVLNLNISAIHDPLEDGTNKAHALIVGMTPEDDILPGLLARKSKRVHF
jgi:hypothetical protein